MKIIRKTCFGFCLLVLAAALSAASGEQAQFSWQLPDRQVPCNVQVLEEDTPLELTWTTSPNALKGRSADLNLRLQKYRQGAMALAQITVRNTSQRQLRLQFEFTTPLQAGASAEYWDGGFNARPATPGRQPERRQGNDNHNFVQLAAVELDGPTAWVWGLSPDSLVSFWHPVFEYDENDPDAAGSIIRLVLEPGQEERLGLCAGEARGVAYGLLPAAWQLYQQAFPVYFTPAEGVPDNIWGASAEYMAWYAPPNIEMMRRMRVTWDWCYTPFKRVGDLYVRDEEWDYEPLASPFDARNSSMLGRSYNIAEKSAAEFRAERQQYFEQYGLDHGLMFYSLVHWVEKQLAEEKFADSMIADPTRRTELSSWARFHDVEVAVMPMGASFEERIVGDMERVAQEMPLTGFSLDVFIDRERNYSDTVAQNPLPGRAWDERGVYQGIGISMALLAQRLHEIELTDRPFTRPALVGGYATTGYHIDASLYEMTFYGAERRRYPMWRMSMGQKPGVVWTGYYLQRILPNWSNLSRAEFVKAFWGITDYVRLKCFQWGIFPTYSHLLGVDRFQLDMPLLVELVRTGWHPLAPVDITVPDGAWAWPSRYGTGAGSHIVIGSPNERPLRTPMTVDNSLLNAPGEDFTGRCIYVDRRDEGSWLTQELQGAYTSLEVQLPRRDSLVLRSVLAVSGPDGRARARARRDLDALEVTVEFRTEAAAQARLEAPQVPGYRLEGLTVNGRPADAKQQVALNRGRNIIELSYVSEQFAFTQDELDAFPFLDADGGIAFAYVAGESQRRDYARVLRRLNGFFDYYSRQALGVEEPGTMPVHSSAAEAFGMPHVIVEIGEADTGWELLPDGPALRLRAADEAGAVRLTEALLAALEQRYPYIVPYRGGMTGILHPVQVQHQMIGKTLNQMLAEEGLQ